MQFSYSRVSCFNSCPRQFKYRYIDELKTIPSTDPTDALYLGTACHTGIEKTVEEAISQYFSNYPVIDDAHVHEAMKLEYIIHQAKKQLPEGEFEVKIETDEFVGFIDLLVPKGRKHFDIYDFKYSNNVDRYMESGQLHIYKHYYEMTHPGHIVDNLYFVFLPKTQIRQKKTETLLQFRKRLLETLSGMEVRVVKVDYNPDKVAQYLSDIREIKDATEYPKNCTRLCDWCQYQDFCESEGENTMAILPKNERRKLDTVDKKVIYLYGAPMSGKTTLSDKFPDPLMVNTDGNYRLFSAPALHIKDVVTVEGRLRKTKRAWETFKEVVSELEAKQNTFKTIIVDLLDDLYNYASEYICAEEGVDHISDLQWGKGYSLLQNEFLGVLKRLINCDYENIILISHEDSTKNFTDRKGASTTTFKPVIPEKIANKVAGMVDMVARTVVKDDVYLLSFKADELTFGGTRLKVKGEEIPQDYNALMAVYNNATK